MVWMSNVLGLAGLVAVTAAVGGLTGNWWWSVLVGGLAVTVLAVIAQRNAAEITDEVVVEEPVRLADRVRPAA
jgi:ammonia channel protein AmtB